MKKENLGETQLAGRVSGFDRFLSRVTLFLVFGVVMLVFALPALVSIGVLGFGWALWDFSTLPGWGQILLGVLLTLYLILQACLFFGIGKKTKIENRQ